MNHVRSTTTALMIGLGAMTVLAGGVQGSLLEPVTQITYQNDGGLPGDAPDACGLGGPSVQASEDEHDFMGQLVPADDERDHWMLTVDGDQVGRELALHVTEHEADPVEAITVRITVLSASCETALATASGAHGGGLVLSFVPPSAGDYVVAIALERAMAGPAAEQALLGASPDSDHCAPMCVVDYLLEMLNDPHVP